MKRIIIPGLLAAAVLAAGCFGNKDNPVKPPVEGPVYSQSTPQNTLRSLVIAYTNRDSVEYAKLYAPDYQGTSYDTDTLPGLQAGTFTRDDEIRHIRKLAETTGIVRIAMNFGSSSAWVREPVPDPDHESWAMITISRPMLDIDGYSWSWAIPSSETFTFSFSPVTPAAGSPTDTLWTIVRWEEIGGP